jgi:hypothetical protein
MFGIIHHQPTKRRNEMTTYTIPQKMSGSGSIHDIASDMYGRDIVFGPGCKYAVVLASYYGGKGYTTHRSESAAIAASRRNSDYSHDIIDTNGNKYAVCGDELVGK